MHTLIDNLEDPDAPKILPFYRHLSPFSNFYHAPFIFDGDELRTSEHHFMLCKARYFGDDEAATDILNAVSPGEAKMIGRRVKRFDPMRWDAVSGQYMHHVCSAKFANDPLFTILLETGDAHLVEASPTDKIWGAHLVEASPTDKIWGVGLGENEADIAHPSRWRGSNRLGEVLMSVRSGCMIAAHGLSLGDE